MGMRFASGNVFYMNRMYSARHLNGVGSPLSMGFVTPIGLRNFATIPPLCGIGSNDGLLAADLTKPSEPAGSTRAAEEAIIRVLRGFDMIPVCVLKDAFVCASEDAPDRL